jgi:hypothetical protein
MAQGKDNFLDRWSRLKHESKALAEEKDKKDEGSPAPVLPALDKLTPESDFTGFMHPKVEDALRRVALKKLFSDPHFNVADPFEAYSGDWTGGEPISQEVLATLNQARTLLFDQDKDRKEEEEEEKPVEQAKDDEPGRQET